MNKNYQPAFDTPTTAHEALQWLEKQGDPTCMTFDHRKAAVAAKLLRESHDGLRAAVCEFIGVEDVPQNFRNMMRGINMVACDDKEGIDASIKMLQLLHDTHPENQ